MGGTRETRAENRAERRASGFRQPMEFPVPQPTTPFSGNVHPVSFDDYVAARKGIGHPVILALYKAHGACRAKPKRTSRGVIWNGRVFWWSEKGYYRNGNKEYGPRRPLQHYVWENHHGKKIPKMHEIFFRDRNRNNFSAENLELLSKGDLHKRCVELGEVPQQSNEVKQQIAGRRWARHARNITSMLLKRSQKTGENHALITSLKNRKNT